MHFLLPVRVGCETAIDEETMTPGFQMGNYSFWSSWPHFWKDVQALTLQTDLSLVIKNDELKND